VLIVAHSMGGLVARAYLRKWGGVAVRLLVTIGTPHRGSRLAWMMTGASVAEMRPSSAFLAGLNGAIERADGVPVISLWSWHDSMVAPQVSSRLDWADNVVISGVAHNALLRDRSVWRRVAESIREARATNDEARAQSAPAPLPTRRCAP
jgi:triacylglycerol esterase/lipase EstA (alpha/beta hydrolase family)